MEDFLPLLIGVIWLAYSLYNKGQKKKAKRNLPEGEKNAPVSSFIEELLLGKEQNPPVQVYSESFDDDHINDSLEEISPIEIVQSHDSKPIITSDLEDFTVEGQHVFSDEELIRESIFSSGANNDIEEFNLRKAVIYSEILNAPYV